MLGLAGQSRGGDKGVLEENIFYKNSANRSIMSALLVAIVCFGKGRWVNQNIFQNIGSRLDATKNDLKDFFSH